MQTKIIHEGTVNFEGAVGVDRPALRRAIEVAVASSNKDHCRSMRSPLTAASWGVRPWPEKLTPETVSSWIAANVSYSTPWEASAILKALVVENGGLVADVEA